MLDLLPTTFIDTPVTTFLINVIIIEKVNKVNVLYFYDLENNWKGSILKHRQGISVLLNNTENIQVHENIVTLAQN